MTDDTPKRPNNDDSQDTPPSNDTRKPDDHPDAPREADERRDDIDPFEDAERTQEEDEPDVSDDSDVSPETDDSDDSDTEEEDEHADTEHEDEEDEDADEPAPPAVRERPYYQRGQDDDEEDGEDHSERPFDDFAKREPEGSGWGFYALLIVSAASAIRLWVAGSLGLGDAEAYYYAWSRHLDLSYYDHPPGVAYLIDWGTRWLGDTVLGVRVLPALLSALAAMAMYFFTASLMRSRRAGFFAALLFVCSPVFFIGGVAAAPDAALVFMWLLAAMLLSRAIQNASAPALVWVGVAVGLGLLAKYTMLLFWPAAILALLFSARGRKLLFSPWFLGALAASLVVFSPVLYWNYLHDWASFSYHIGRNSDGAFNLSSLGIFAGGQALYLSPVIFIGLVLAAFRALWRLLNGRGKNAALVFFLSVPVLAVGWTLAIYSPESEPHWPLVGYLLLFPLLGDWIGNASWRSPGKAERFALMGPLAIWFSPSRRALLSAWALFPALLINVVLLVHLATDLGFMLIPEDSYNPKLDISNELYGWDQVDPLIARDIKKMGAGAFVASYHYTMCGQLSFISKGRWPVACLSRRTDAFDFFSNSPDVIGKNGLFVTDNRYTDDPQTRILCKGGIEKLDSLTIRRAGMPVRQFHVYACKDYRHTLSASETERVRELEQKPGRAPEQAKPKPPAEQAPVVQTPVAPEAQAPAVEAPAVPQQAIEPPTPAPAEEQAGTTPQQQEAQTQPEAIDAQHSDGDAESAEAEPEPQPQGEPTQGAPAAPEQTPTPAQAPAADQPQIMDL